MSTFVHIPPQDYSGTAFNRFSAQRAAFHLDDARAMMWMSQLAYETDSPSTVEAVYPRWGFTSLSPLRAQERAIDTRCIVGERPDCTLVAFAGTDPALFANLATNANFRLSSVDTHQGFQNAFEAVWDSVETRIRESTRPLFFTGHSLGAALAVLAAERAVDRAMAPATVYGFGMPRAGGAAFAGRYNSKLGERTFRLVHGADIIARVPDGIIDVGGPGLMNAPRQFRHVGRMLSCPAGGTFDPAMPLADIGGNDPRFVAGARSNFRNRVDAALAGQFFSPTGPGFFGPLYSLLPFAISDHLPDRYRRALGN